jgi:hypothetical protein
MAKKYFQISNAAKEIKKLQCARDGAGREKHT